jgi:hypothetical protein
MTSSIDWIMKADIWLECSAVLFLMPPSLQCFTDAIILSEKALLA